MNLEKQQNTPFQMCGVISTKNVSITDEYTNAQFTITIYIILNRGCELKKTI